MLETTYTLYSDDGGYLSQYDNDSYLFQNMECPRTTFTDISEAWALWYELSNNEEFSWTTIHIIQTDKHKIKF